MTAENQTGKLLSKIWVWYGLALLVVLGDYLTKQWITLNLEYREVIPVSSFLNIVLVHNTGAAFSFLSEAGGWQRWFFSIIAAAISCWLMVWLYLLPKGKTLLSLSLALILGGALGNLFDRVSYGYVIDFIDVFYQSYHWPAFNVADAGITVGAVLLVFENLFSALFTSGKNSV